MRVMLQNDQSGDILSKQLIDIGNGNCPIIYVLTICITYPESFCQLTQSKAELIQKVFPNVAQNYLFHDWFSERFILAVQNTDVNELNSKIQNDIPGSNVFNNNTTNRMLSIKNPLPSIDDIFSQMINKLNIHTSVKNKIIYPNHTPWLWDIKVNTELLQQNKHNTNPNIITSQFILYYIIATH